MLCLVFSRSSVVETKKGADLCVVEQDYLFAPP